MPQIKEIRILCVDDHPLIRDGIAFALQFQKDMKLVGEAKHGEEAVMQFERLLPDVTLMDIQMPGMNGIDAIHAIRKVSPRAKIVVLTTYAGDVQAARALEAGASGYLLKSMLRTELVVTIREVYEGRRRISPEISATLSEHLSANDLSPRETEVLRSVAQGRSNRQIADALLISEDTVKGHMKSIMAKLDAGDRTQAVIIAMKRGFLQA
nr:response regulator transcription factor [Terriglobus saanensis]